MIENQTRITINIDQSLSAQLDELKNKFSHLNPNPSFAELIQLMATQLLKGSSKRQHPIHTKILQPSRYIPAATRRFIFERDKGCCTYEEPLTKKKCGSKFQLEVDHIHAFSLGGSNAAENLRLTCRNHNQYLWRNSADA